MLVDLCLSTAWYATCIVATHLAYEPMGSLIQRWYGQRYSELRPKDKDYICKNSIKGGMLALATPMTIFVLMQRIIHSQWQHIGLARAIGSLYAANDVVALVKVPLPRNTQIHHCCVALMSIVNLFIDYTNKSNIWTNMIMLCGLSMLSYIVNMYLGLRKIEESRVLAGAGLIAYVPTLALNVGWQITHIAKALPSQPVSSLAYLAIVCSIFWDDSVLIRHLLKVVQTPTEEKKQSQPRAERSAVVVP